MKSPTSVIAALLLATIAVAPANAHDPAEHAKESTDPDCAALQQENRADADTADPVMQALMQKCGAHGAAGHGAQESVPAAQGGHSGHATQESRDPPGDAHP